MFHKDHSLLSNEVSSTNTMACPACREIIMASVTSCRFCGLPIDARTAAQANAAQQALNSAIIQANALKYAGPIALVIAVLLVLNTFGAMSDGRLLMAWLAPPIAIFSSWRWTHRHGSLLTSDSELALSRKNVRRSMQMWCAVLALELVLLAWAALRLGLSVNTQPH